MSNSYDGEHNKERNLTSGSGDAFGAEPDEMVDLFAVAENADNRDDAVLPGQSESSGSDFYPIVFDDFSYEDQDEDDEDGYSEEDEDDGDGYSEEDEDDGDENNLTSEEVYRRYFAGEIDPNDPEYAPYFNTVFTDLVESDDMVDSDESDEYDDEEDDEDDEYSDEEDEYSCCR